MIRRLFLGFVIFVLAVLTVADRVAVHLAAKAVAVKARSAAHLDQDPSVQIHGFPFLTQAISGKYTEIDIEAHGLVRGGVRLETVSARLYGVHVPLSKVLRGDVRNVPIDRGAGQVLLLVTDLNAVTRPRGVTVSSEGTALTLSGYGVRAVASVAVAGTTLVLTPRPRLLPASIADRLSVRIDISRLPFGIQLTGVTVLPAGIEISASADGIDVPVSGP